MLPEGLIRKENSSINGEYAVDRSVWSLFEKNSQRIGNRGALFGMLTKLEPKLMVIYDWVTGQ